MIQTTSNFEAVGEGHLLFSKFKEWLEYVELTVIGGTLIAKMPHAGC